VKPVAPEWAPPSWADARAAWTARYADLPGVDLRIEAAAYRGRVVYLSVMTPWTGAQHDDEQTRTGWVSLLAALEVVLLLASIGGSLMIARRNLQLGRGDRRGAAGVAVAGMLLVLGSWAFKAHHVATTEELLLFIQATAWALFFGGWACVLYLAIEPSIRRRWPHALIGWSRLLAGRWRDPLVGRDILVGCSAGLLVAILSGLHLLAHGWWWPTLAAQPATPVLVPLHGARFVAHILCYYLFQAGLSTLLIFFLLFLARLVVRRDVVLVAAVLATTAVLTAISSQSPVIDVAVEIVGWGLTFVVLLRFGLLALTLMTLLQTMLGVTSGSPFPISFQFDSWLGGPTIAAMLFITGIVVYAFRISVGGKTLLGPALDR
jgi:serine/threonine-protein kinase